MKKMLTTISILAISYMTAQAEKLFDVKIDQFSLDKTYVRPGETFTLSIKYRLQNIRYDLIYYAGIILDLQDYRYLKYQSHTSNAIARISRYVNQYDFYDKEPPNNKQYYANIKWKIDTTNYNCQVVQFYIDKKVFSYRDKPENLRSTGMVDYDDTAFIVQTVNAIPLSNVDLVIDSVRNGELVDRSKNIIKVYYSTTVRGRIILENSPTMYGSKKVVYGSGNVPFTIYSQNRLCETKNIECYSQDNKTNFCYFTLNCRSIKQGEIDKLMIRLPDKNNANGYICIKNVDKNDIQKDDLTPPKLTIKLQQKSDKNTSYTTSDITAENYIDYIVSIKSDKELNSLTFNNSQCPVNYELVNLEYDTYYMNCTIIKTHDNKKYINCNSRNNIPANSEITLKYRLKIK